MSSRVDQRVFEGARPVDEVLSEYAELGYARVGRLLSGARLAALQGRIDDIMLGRVVYPGMFFQHDTESGRYEDLHYGRGYEGPSLRYRKIEKLELDPLFRAWVEEPLLYQLASRWVGPELVIYRALLFNKAAETGGSNLPWHQDGGSFWGLDREPTFQVWTALDDAPLDGGCLEVFAGSHQRGLVTPLGGVVPEPFVTQQQPELHSVFVPAQAGEVILVHNHMWHRSARSRTGQPRRAMTVCYMDAATRCKRKKRAPRAFFPVFRAKAEPAATPLPMDDTRNPLDVDGARDIP
jgi:ectoine hydroxylase-related dioxygenase (phytanoyl-CoA dioxygenase family)